MLYQETCDALLVELVRAFQLEASSASPGHSALQSLEEAQQNVATAASVLYSTVQPSDVWLHSKSQLQSAALFVNTFLQTGLSISTKTARAIRRACLKPCKIIPTKIGHACCRAMLPGVASQCVRFLVHPAESDGPGALATLQDAADVLEQFVLGVESDETADSWMVAAAPKMAMCLSALLSGPQQSRKQDLRYLRSLCRTLRHSTLAKHDASLAHNALFLSLVIARGKVDTADDVSLRAEVESAFGSLRQEVLQSQHFFLTNATASLLAVSSPNSIDDEVFDRVMRGALRTMHADWTEREYFALPPASSEIDSSLVVLGRWQQLTSRTGDVLADWDAYPFHPGAIYLLLRGCVTGETSADRLVATGEFERVWAAVTQEHLWRIEQDSDGLSFQQIQHRALVAATVIAGLAGIVAQLGEAGKRRSLRRLLLLTLYDVMEKCCDAQSCLRENALAFVTAVQKVTLSTTMCAALADYTDVLFDDASRAVTVDELRDRAVNVVRGCLAVHEAEGASGALMAMPKLKVALAIGKAAFRESPHNALKLVSLCAALAATADSSCRATTDEASESEDEENPSPASSGDATVRDAQEELYATLMHLERSMNSIAVNDRRHTIDAAMAIFVALCGSRQARQPLLPAVHIWYTCLVDTILGSTGLRLADVAGILGSRSEKHVLQRMSAGLDIPSALRALTLLLRLATRFLAHRYVHELLPLALLWCVKGRGSLFARDQDVLPAAMELLRLVYDVSKDQSDAEACVRGAVSSALTPNEATSIFSSVEGP
jgi:hypothetical protein